MQLNVIEDTHVEGNTWKYLFSDKSEVLVTEDYDVAPPVYRKASDITPEQIAAIERYSFWKVV